MESILIKAIDDYNIPQKYKEIAKAYMLDCETILKENLCLLMLTGSCSLESVTDGFSDIDMLIVATRFAFSDMVKLNEEKNKYPLKIATTVYSKNEIENACIDDKTVWFLFLYGKGKIKVNYMYQTIKIPFVDLEMLRGADRVVFPGIIHQTKRLLYHGIDKKTIIKKLSLIMKILLRERGIIPTSYSMTFELFAKEFGFNHYLIEKDLDDEPIKTELIQYGRCLIEYLTNEYKI